MSVFYAFSVRFWGLSRMRCWRVQFRVCHPQIGQTLLCFSAMAVLHRGSIRMLLFILFATDFHMQHTGFPLRCSAEICRFCIVVF
jgi:hypothetical protein